MALARGLLRTILGVSCLTVVAHAEPARADPFSGVADEKARQTFREGIEAFDRRDFEAARVAFLQTFALKPSLPVVRRNLGLAEIYSGHYLEGARRLAQVLHTTDDGSVQDRARMQESLRKAEAHLERVTLEVNVGGAKLVVDDVELGVSPLPFVWYVAPGPYSVRVEKAGFQGYLDTRVARAGRAEHLRIELVPEPGMSSPALSPAARMDAPRSGPETWILVAGGVGTALGLGAGITLSLAAADDADEVDALREQLVGFSCPNPAVPGCEDLASVASRHDREADWAQVSFAAAGVIGISTLVYAWLASREPAPVAAAGVGSAAPDGFSVEWSRSGVSLRQRF